MGEVGTNSADNPHADLKMNGGINGNCDDDLEAMDVDAEEDTPNQAVAAKITDTSDKPSTPTVNENENDSDNVMELDTSGNSDGIELITSDKNNENDIEKESVETKAHENGAVETDEKCDQEPIKETHSDDDDALTEKEPVTEEDSETNKIVEDSESTVKVSSDPLSADAEPILEDDKHTNQSGLQSTENGRSATITSSNDKKG